MFREDVEKLDGFIKFDEPVKFTEFECIGYFPYEVAKFQDDISPRVPRSIFHEIERVMRQNHVSDNKHILICIDTLHFGTENFALQLKDCWAKLGNLISYHGGKL
jgi:hypothetical protein